MGKISNYTQAIASKLTDFFVIDQTDNGTTDTKKVSTEQIGEAINGLQTYSGLDTANKTIVDALNEIASYTPVYGNTASGAIATFDTSLALPLQDLQIAINAVQESGTPTPSSPKLISGFTGANIHVADDENPHIIDNVTPITWQTEAGTVYGGSLDVTSGKLTVTHKSYVIDSDSPIYMNASGAFTLALSDKALTNTDLMCSCFEPKNGLNYTATSIMNVSGDNVIGQNNGNNIVYIKATSYTSASDLKTAIEGEVIVYKLATPVTYQLTPTQISAIVGTNNVFTDTNGNTSVVYACSLKDYIDSQ